MRIERLICDEDKCKKEFKNAGIYINHSCVNIGDSREEIIINLKPEDANMHFCSFDCFRKWISTRIKCR